MAKIDGSEAKYVRHSRSDVTAAALAILDDFGLADLTMRRLAATLDVQPSALYWHFANKQTLLASVADTIVAKVRPIDPAVGWKAATRQTAEALRDTFLTYRDGAEIVSSTLALGLGATEAATLLEARVSAAGFDRRTCTVAASALLHFILGHVSHEQQRLQGDSVGATAPNAEASAGDRESFDFGITLLLDGLEVQRDLHALTVAQRSSR